jgi:omega-amidase
MATTRAAQLIVALGEYDTGWHDPEQSLKRAGELARQAKASGAQLLVLPEMCASGFTMEAKEFAESEDGPSARSLSQMATENQLWIVAGLAMRRGKKYVNSALTFAPDGSLAARYDKQKLFGYAKETEVYTPGSGPCIAEIGGLSVGLFVCFDLRFPELFRAVGPKVDAFVLVANWPTDRQSHWEILTQARAIENQCYMVAVNRVGEGDGLSYTGGSVIYDPWGERCDKTAKGSALRTGVVTSGVVGRVRRAFPLATDTRRTDGR